MRVGCLALCALLLFSAVGCAEATTLAPDIELVVAMPYSPLIENIDQSAYKLWLEEQTGLSLRFRLVQEQNLDDYLEPMSSPASLNCDVLWGFSVRDSLPETNVRLQRYASRGYILPLNNYLESDSRLSEVFADFTRYDLRRAITAADGNLYYVPWLEDYSESRRSETLWINRGWLNTLELPVPSTTDELWNTLAAFHLWDPNGNGAQDEIPLLGGTETEHFLMSAFVPMDRQNGLLTLDSSGNIVYAPALKGWRAGGEFLAELYMYGLIPPLEPTANSLAQLAADPRDLLGGFVASKLTDVIPANSPEVMARYVPVGMLENRNGSVEVMAARPMPKPYGLISATCRQPREAFRLMDFMLSEEASLFARLGREGENWQRKADGGVSVLQDLEGIPNKQTLGGLCPGYLPARYTDAPQPSESGARYGAETDLLIPGVQSAQYLYLQTSVHQVTKEHLARLLNSGSPQWEDKAWAEYLAQLEQAGLPELLELAREMQ